MKKIEIEERVAEVLDEAKEILEKMKKYSDKKITKLEKIASKRNSFSNEDFLERIDLLNNIRRYHTSKIVKLYGLIDTIEELEGIVNGKKAK